MENKIEKFGKNVEVPANFEQKCLVVFVLDTSYSMSDDPIDQLNAGIQSFHRDILNDYQLSGQLEVGIVTFNSVIEVVQEPALPEDFEMPTLTTSGSTRLCAGIQEGYKLIENRKEWYKSTGQKYYRPWICLITDAMPDEDQDIVELKYAMQTAHKAKAFNFIPLGVNSADFNLLKNIAQPGVPPLKLEGLRFQEFFKFLSASFGEVLNSRKGDIIDLGFGQVIS